MSYLEIYYQHYDETAMVQDDLIAYQCPFDFAGVAKGTKIECTENCWMCWNKTKKGA